MGVVFLIGRIILGIFYIYNSGNHFANVNLLSGYAASKGVPAPKYGVLAGGVLLLIGGLSMITGYQPLVGVIAIVLFFLPVSFVMHNFWKDSDPEAKSDNTINFTKNMGLMGSALMFLAIPSPWPLSLGM